MTSLKHKIKLTRMLDLPIFRKVCSIKLTGGVSVIDLSSKLGRDMTDYPPELSTEFCQNLEKNQLSDLLRKFARGKLKHLQFDHMDFSKINYKVLANAINSLESFSSEFCIFRSGTIKQIIEIFRQMSEESTKLKSLKIWSSKSDLYFIPPVHFARGVNKLKSLYLGWEPYLGLLKPPTIQNTNSISHLHQEQLLEMFSQMSVKTNLKKVHLFLALRECKISAVPAETLAEAVSKLEEFVAPRMEFSSAQIKCVLIAASKKSSKIRKLDLGSNFGPRFINVDIGILTKVMNKIEMNDFKLLMTMRSIEFRNQQVLSAEVVYADMVENRKRKLMEDESVEVLKNMPKEKRMKNMIERRLERAFIVVERADIDI